MTDNRFDAEKLGALLDGTLHPDERAAVLARLAADEEARDVFADTAAVLRELEEEDAATADTAPSGPRLVPGAGTPTRPAARRIPRWATGLIAATLVASIGIPLAMRTRGLPTPEQSLLASSGHAPLPDGWALPWTRAVRGPRDPATPADTGVIASRLGVIHYHLALAVANHDAPAKAEAIADAKGLLEGDWGLLAASYEELSADGTTAQQVADVGEEAERVLGKDRFRLGAWAEAARLAAARRDEGFFRSTTTRAFFDGAGGQSRLSPAASGAIHTLRTLFAPGRGLDWAVISQTTTKISTAISR